MQLTGEIYGIISSISPHVGNLRFLKILTLFNNSFHNEIPSEIDHLHKMRFLELQNDTLDGKIPSNLSNCSNLEAIHVAYNFLV